MERALLITIKALVALVLLTPLIVMADPFPHTFFPYIVGKALYSRTLTEIAFGLWAALALRHPSYRVPKSRLLLIFAVYGVVVLLASVFGVSPQRSIWSTYERMQGFVDLAHWFAFTWVLTSVFRSWADWRTLLNLNLGVSFIMGLLGLSQLLDIKVLEFLAATERLDITLGNPTYVGAYMLVNVLIAMGFLGHSLLCPAPAGAARSQAARRKRTRRRPAARQGMSTETWWRVFWVATIILDALILYLSGTRGAFVGLVAGLVAFAVGYLIWGRPGRLRIASMVLIGSLVALVLVLIPLRTTDGFQKMASSSVTLSRIANTGLDDASLKGHINSAVVGLRGFAARPILGWGPENFTIAYDRHVTPDMIAGGVTSFDQAHNKLVEELTTTGILGFLGYMGMWLYMLWVVVRRVREQSAQNQVFTLFAAAALTGYFVQNLFLFDTPGTVVQFILLLGYVAYLDITADQGAVASATAGVSIPAPAPPSNEQPAVFRSETTFALALALIGVLVLLAISAINLGPYLGATTILETLYPQKTWEERIDIFERTMDVFPGLANYPRIVMFNQLSNNWQALNEREARAALDAAVRAEQDALRSEPQEWRIHVSASVLYQLGASLDPAYLERARSLLEEARELAPERIEVHQVMVRQYILEGDYDGAYAAIDSYLSRNPQAASYFEGFRREIDAAVSQTQATSSPDQSGDSK